MNWQTYHGCRLIVGRVNSYVPQTRADLDRDFQRVPQRDALLSLKSAGVSYVVFHKNLILPAARGTSSPRLKSSLLDLTQRLDDDETAIFRDHSCQLRSTVARRRATCDARADRSFLRAGPPAFDAETAPRSHDPLKARLAG